MWITTRTIFISKMKTTTFYKIIVLVFSWKFSIDIVKYYSICQLHVALQTV